MAKLPSTCQVAGCRSTGWPGSPGCRCQRMHDPLDRRAAGCLKQLRVDAAAGRSGKKKVVLPKKKVIPKPRRRRIKLYCAHCEAKHEGYFNLSPDVGPLFAPDIGFTCGQCDNGAMPSIYLTWDELREKRRTERPEDRRQKRSRKPADS